jgi:flagellar protein FliO/FliZ
MELTKLLQSGLALFLVLMLVVLFSLLIRKLNENKLKGFKISERRLKIVEILPIDAKSKFLIIKKDSKEYFVLSGAEKSDVLEVSEVKNV